MPAESWGFIHKIMIYSGYDVSESMTRTEFVVENLMNGLYHTKVVYNARDNFYNSVKMARKLLKKKNYVTGTLRSNRKHNSKDVIAQTQKRESICRYTENKICVVKWKDKRDVLTISSEFSHSVIDIIKICLE